ncbi:unnamed protein product [Rotaria magnacalcarata]|uniref:Uncharacterized protein n=1 Tax=Rotaria magnacalcarata TaxID=392030 RepID=A0A819Z047_9BILA|nr:unnamed protein product [Rotaria magnacalcarata]CAF4168980.1 unnamed protein product [Rotaria magnacalcarata]
MEHIGETEKKMNFESLANELLLYLFKFLRTDHLIYAFHGLNSRFYSLLLHHFTVYGIDSRLFHHNDFVIMCEKYFPTLIDKVSSLYLSEKEDSLKLFNQLNAHGFAIDQFIQLKSLSLSYLSEEQIMDQIMFALPHFINITHLTLQHCSLPQSPGSVSEEQINARPFINCIWSLPKLTHCCFINTFVCKFSSAFFTEPTVISSSITHLFLFGVHDDALCLDRICETTPKLQHFSESSPDLNTSEIPRFPLLSMTSLELSCTGCGSTLLHILQWIPNLYRLKLKDIPYINGHEWESCISNHLPKLKIFNFQMEGRFSRNETIDVQVDDMLNKFRTQFWLDEHGWFIACYYEPTNRSFYLCTLPYVFDTFQMRYPLLYKSTCSNENNDQSFDTVRHLIYDVQSMNDCSSSNIRFYKLETLEIKVALRNYFWSIVPTLNHLTSCTIASYDNSQECINQLQLLLSRATRLTLLKFTGHSRDISIENLLLETNNASIKRLNLQTNFISYDEEQCARFSCTRLAVQCEELHIRVKSRISICYLIKTMYNLRLVYVKYDDDEYDSLRPITGNEKFDNSEKYDIISWLWEQLLGIRRFVEITGCYKNVVLRLS